MTADQLYDNIRSYLRLTARVIRQVGGDINEGEKFTVRFTASNQAYSANLVSKPRIVFLDPYIHVQGTEYATPDKPGWSKFPDAVLWPGEATHVDIGFKADKNMGGFFDLFLVERIAKAHIWARLDQDRFFEIWNYLDVFEEITPT